MLKALRDQQISDEGAHLFPGKPGRARAPCGHRVHSRPLSRLQTAVPEGAARAAPGQGGCPCRAATAAAERPSSRAPPLLQVLKLAAEEFQDVIFVKVFADEAAEGLTELMSVKAFPSFTLYAGGAGRVADFTASLTAEGLLRLRSFLRHFSSPPALEDEDHADWPVAESSA